MKTVAWTIENGSGMHRVAESIYLAEKSLGIDAYLCNPQHPDDGRFDHLLDADIHISHTHIPDSFRRKITKKHKIVFIPHGVPEYVFETAVEEGMKGSYGHPDSWMLTQHHLRTSDEIVTFWPRHQAIWQSLCDKNTKVKRVPLGIDKTFWKKMPSQGKFAGTPSVLTCENQHRIKWSLDLFLMWGPWVAPNVKGEARLHNPYLPNNISRYFFPLANRNDTSYWSHISPIAFDHNTLRNAFNSVDFFIGLVQKGDFNRLCLEANACGVPTISYYGNPYSSFWLPEGDQRVIAAELVKILNGEVEPRKDKQEVPDVLETAQEMIKIYESL